MKIKFYLSLLLFTAFLITRIQAQTYSWTTIAGLYASSGSQDGTNTSALFKTPQGIAVDGAGNIFISDTGNYSIRKISPTNGNWVVTTIAGSSTGQGNADGIGGASRFAIPGRMALDGFGNVFVQDYFASQTIRRLTFNGTNWAVTTPASNLGEGTAAGGLAVDFAGNIYCLSNYALVRFSPLVTNGVSATNYSAIVLCGLAGANGGLDGTNAAARFNTTSQVWAIDGNGVIYLSDSNHIRTVTPVGGNYVATTLTTPALVGMAMDHFGNAAALQASTIQYLNYGQTSWYSIGGTNVSGGVDGTNNQARFTTPIAVSGDSSGTIFVADTGGQTIRRGTNLTGTAFGSLQVNLTSDASVITNLAWRVDGGNWQTNGAIVNNLQVGSHAVSFQNVYGWMTPTNQLVVIGTNATTLVTANYTQIFGSLIGYIAPTGAIAAGGQWQIDGGAYQTNGAVISGLTVGPHVVSFSTVLGWLTPTNQTISIVPYLQLTNVGTYFALGAVGVTINPPAVTNIGAQWQIDGGSFQTGGTIVSNINPGLHTISFQPVIGWITPNSQSVNVLSGQTTNLAATYTSLGSIQVTILPTNAAMSGATWTVDGGASQISGMTVSNLAIGVHTVSYSALASWIAPANQVVNLVAGQTTNISGTYTALGSLQVTIVPPGAIAAGAAWQADGGAWQSNAAIVSNLTAGVHSVTFTNVVGWNTPPPQTNVIISLNQITSVSAVYGQQFGSVQVLLTPAGVISLGAQWQLDGGAWQNSGTTLPNVALGSHALNYTALTNWTSPTNATVTVTANQTTIVRAVYSGQSSLQVILAPSGVGISGAQWQLDGGTWQPSGAVLTGLSRGTHAITFKYASGWLTPTNQNINIIANQFLSVTGAYTALSYAFNRIAGAIGANTYADGTNMSALFDAPSGLAIDQYGNIFVADTGNSVIRLLSPTTNGWVSQTIAGLAGSTGSVDGQNSQARFNYPTGVAVDTNENVYVADQANYTIRLLTTDGTNWTVSTIAGAPSSPGSINGTNSVARFNLPFGVAVDSAGNVYVADQGNSLIRKLVSLGSNNWASSTVAGAAGQVGNVDGVGTGTRFNWPSDLTVDGNGILYVADTLNNTIRKITLNTNSGNYVVATLCGSAGINGSLDGSNSVALFDGPSAITVDAAGNLYVTDSYSSVIRKISPVGFNWVVNTIGGFAYNYGSTDGINSAARFNEPAGIGVDANGVIYVADTYNETIRAGTLRFAAPVVPNLNVVSRMTNVSLNWLSTTGLNYQVQYKTNLIQSYWANLGTFIPATNTSLQFIDSSTNGQRFYRLVGFP